MFSFVKLFPVWATGCLGRPAFNSLCLTISILLLVSPVWCADELADVTELSHVALRRYQPAFKPSENECFSAAELLGILPTSPKSVEEALARLCPVILLQDRDGACSSDNQQETAQLPMHRGKARPTPAQGMYAHPILYIMVPSILQVHYDLQVFHRCCIKGRG